MAVTPQTNIFLLKVPIAIDNKNQLTFANATAQHNYFNGLPKIEIDNCSYLRKDSIIRFPGHIDTIIEYNYCMYQNENYSNKWFYAFISNMQYTNDGLTNISIKTDVFQTWQFDLTYKKCFVEREHVSNDTAGLHTVPENLEIGDYVQNNVNHYSFGDIVFLIQAQKLYNDQTVTPRATNIGGIPYAGAIYLADTYSEFINIIGAFNNPNNGVSIDNITNCWIVPKAFVNYENVDTHSRWGGQNTPKEVTHSISKPSSLDGYTPKNKKLLTYPFIALLMSNNNGNSNVLRIEEFSTNDCQFEIVGTPTVGGSIKCSPRYYKNHGSGGYEEEKILAGKFPTLSWSADAFTNWLTQNAVNNSVGFATDIGFGIGNALAGNIGGALNGAMGVINRMAQIEQQKFAPNSAKGNTNGGDITTLSGANHIYFYILTIKSEYAKMIDDFFSMYGYKVNSLKVPNITGRTNWNYVKTVDCIITANIPQKDLQEIKNMFDDGITLWHNANTFLDYSQSN